MKLYDGLEKIDSIASVYASRGMPGFYPYKVWDKLDSNMVPIVQYPFGNYRNPVNIAQTAIAFYNQYLKTGDAIERARFLNNINWLMRNHKSYYFRYEFRYQHAFAPVMEKGWISAMAQGQGLGALSVAFT
ncbi:MAG: D-glucuronyl C5-epimerase family protein [candidate division KSB1 bacterium]|nr:D-glucuronyl C5-epimerase family protein [candidate division KSB1 bacterium]MDZ7305107.1 D-glucuronyl C5-epimerase family protein [candidate division KSB1 bacterium]MDZ7314192.1 D-glucuronyl C5-epimerase family protein [candidate division KSB1 bacterium]